MRLIDLQALLKEPTEISDRLLAAALCWVSSNPYRPRYAALRRCSEAVTGGAAQALHGCLLYPWKGKLRITREYQAVADMRVIAAPKALWDGRWRLNLLPLAHGTAAGWVIKPLGEAGAQAVRPLLPKDIPLGNLDSDNISTSQNLESTIKESISTLKKASGKKPLMAWIETEFAKSSFLEHEKDLDLTSNFLGISVTRLKELLKN